MCWARQFQPASGLVRRRLSRCRVVFSACGSLAYYGHVVLRVVCVCSRWSCTSSERSWYCGPAGPRPTAPRATTGRLSLASRPPAALGQGSRAALGSARHGPLRQLSGGDQAGVGLRGGGGAGAGLRRDGAGLVLRGGAGLCRGRGCPVYRLRSRERFRGSVITVTLPSSS